tara:strand:- start:357 stop:908 length:552 start_codon:yes stop_codon:yes gene_type:complete
MESYQDLIDELLTVKFGKSSRQMNCVTELLLNPYVIPIQLSFSKKNLKPQLLEVLNNSRERAMLRETSDFEEIIDLYVSIANPDITRRTFYNFRRRQKLLQADIFAIKERYWSIDHSDVFGVEDKTLKFYIIVCRKMRSKHTENCKLSTANMRLQNYFPRTNDFFRIYFNAAWNGLQMNNVIP